MPPRSAETARLFAPSATPNAADRHVSRDSSPRWPNHAARRTWPDSVRLAARRTRWLRPCRSTQPDVRYPFAMRDIVFFSMRAPGRRPPLDEAALRTVGLLYGVALGSFRSYRPGSC